MGWSSVTLRAAAPTTKAALGGALLPMLMTALSAPTPSVTKTETASRTNPLTGVSVFWTPTARQRMWFRVVGSSAVTPTSPASKCRVSFSIPTPLVMMASFAPRGTSVCRVESVAGSRLTLCAQRGSAAMRTQAARARDHFTFKVIWYSVLGDCFASTIT